MRLMRQYVAAGLVIFLIAATAGACAGCSDEPVKSLQFFAMDTFMEIHAYGPDAQVAIYAAKDEIVRIEALFSITDENSEIFRINHAFRQEAIIVDEEVFDLIEKSLVIAAQSDGAFDISVAPLMDLWGFRDQTYRMPDDASIKEACDRIGWDRMILDRATRQLTFPDSGWALDLGGVAKGYAANRAISVLRTYNLYAGAVSLGGDVVTFGQKPDGTNFRIAITDPQLPSQYIGVITLADKAVVTSGGYERYLSAEHASYIHIMDPRTGRPVQNEMLSVTVLASDAALADAWSTAFFVMGKDESLEKLKHLEQLLVVLVTDDNTVYVSPDLLPFFQQDASSAHELQVIGEGDDGG